MTPGGAVTPTATTSERPPLQQRNVSNSSMTTGSLSRRPSSDSLASFAIRTKMSRRSSLEDIGAMRNQRKMQQRPSMDALEKGIMAMESEVVAGVMAKEKTPSERQSSHRNKL
eukprot:14827417-Ditylum_brightwellii.AAC.1